LLWYALTVHDSWYVMLLCQVVFRSGQGALQVLPPLVDVIPEARLNLVIYHLRQGQQRLHCDLF